MYRKTYAEIDHETLTNNIKEIIKKYPDYKYYFGIVKNNAYHHGIKIVNALKEGGINYFAVSSLEEAMELRKYNIDTPVLILEPIESEYIYDCITNNITITIENFEQIKEINDMKLAYELKIHLKIDTGMNRIGFKDSKELEKTVKVIKENEKLYLEGIYSHFATSGIVDKNWDKQLKNFEALTQNINLSEIPIVHLGRSLTLVNHEKIKFCNGIRLGIIMYGFAQSKPIDKTFKSKIRNWKKHRIQKKNKISETTEQNNLNLSTAFSLFTHVMSIRKINKNEPIGYNANYNSKKDGYILTLPIGYADGVDKSFQYVSINNQKYPIIADSMDMLMVFSDTKIQIGTKVEIFGKNISVSEVTSKLNSNAYHLFNQIQNRVTRVHKNHQEQEETNY